MYKTRILVEGTVVAALALVLSFIPTTIGSSFTISLGMIPLTLFALRRGLKPALMAAFIWGILHFPASQVVYLSVVQVSNRVYLCRFCWIICEKGSKSFE